MLLRCVSCGRKVRGVAVKACPTCGGKMDEWSEGAEKLRARKETLAANKIQRAWKLHRATQATLLSERAVAQPSNPKARRNRLPITEQRQAALQALDNNYLTELYGLRVIADMTGHEHAPDLMIGNTYNTSYLRDAFDKQWGSLKGTGKSLIIETVGRLRKKPGNMEGTTWFWLVNSRHAVDRLQFLCGGDNPILGSAPRLVPTDVQVPGLYLISYTLNAGKDFGAQLDANNRFVEYFKYIGATPSTYLMYRFLNGAKGNRSQEPALFGEGSHADVAFENQNHKLLRALVRCVEFRKLQTLAASERPMRYIYDAAAKLIQGLESLYLNRKFNKGVLVKSALESLTTLVKALVFYDRNAERARRVYDLILDEVFLILAAVRPYPPEAFMRREGEIQDRRIPALKRMLEGERGRASIRSGRIQRVVHPCWSGMDALTTALEAAIAESGPQVQLVGEGEQATYFEIPEVLAARGELVVRSIEEEIRAQPSRALVYPRVLLATMNPSTPERPGPTAAVIADLVARRYNRLKAPISLIIDATIQSSASVDPERQLDALVEALAGLITDGKVQLLLARSYQKYQSLGSGKFMGGCATLIHASERARSAAFLEGLETAGFRSLDEVQFFTHILTHAADDELGLVGVAATNARLISEITPRFPTYGGGRHVGGSPFSLKASGRDGGNVDLKNWIVRLGLAEYDSFGFAVSSYLDFPGGMRLNAGQESRERIIEKFFAAGHLWSDANADQAQNLPFVNVISQIDSILQRVAAAYPASASQDAVDPRCESLPFDPPDPGPTYARPTAEVLAGRYRSRAKRSAGTDLSHVLASYLALVFRFSREDLVRWEGKGGGAMAAAKSYTPIIQLAPADKTFLSRLCLLLFEKGLLDGVTPEMRAELSGHWLKLLIADQYQVVSDSIFEQLRRPIAQRIARFGAYVPAHALKGIQEEAEAAMAASEKDHSGINQHRVAALVADFIREHTPLLRKDLTKVPKLLASSTPLALPQDTGTWALLTPGSGSVSLGSPAAPSSASKPDPKVLKARQQLEAATALYLAYIAERFARVDNAGGGDCMYYSFDDGLKVHAPGQAAGIAGDTALARSMTIRGVAARETADLIRLGVGVDEQLFRDMPISPQQWVRLSAKLAQASNWIELLRRSGWDDVRVRHRVQGAFVDTDVNYPTYAREAEAFVLNAVRQTRELQELLDSLATTYEAGQRHQAQYAGDLDYRGLVLAYQANLRIHYVDASAAGTARNRGHREDLYQYRDLMNRYYGRAVADSPVTIDIIHVNDDHYVFGRPRG